MKRTYLINDLIWIGLAAIVCWEGLNLDFGSFREPHPGFMPFLSGLVLGVLALFDLVSGILNKWTGENEDTVIWANIQWGKIVLTVAVLFIYTIILSTVGFIVSTTLLLLFLYRVMEPRPWWAVITASVITTGLFYLVFKVGMDSQLPRGLWGF